MIDTIPALSDETVLMGLTTCLSYQLSTSSWHSDIPVMPRILDHPTDGALKYPPPMPSIHPYPCESGLLSVPHSMGRQHQAMSNTGSPCVSVLRDNVIQATITEINLHTFRPRIAWPSPLSRTGTRYACDRFDTGRGTQYKPIPSEPPTVKDCRNILNAKFLVWYTGWYTFTTSQITGKKRLIAQQAVQLTTKKIPLLTYYGRESTGERRCKIDSLKRRQCGRHFHVIPHNKYHRIDID